MYVSVCVSVCPNPYGAFEADAPEFCPVGRGMKLRAQLRKTRLGDASPTQYATSNTCLFRYKVHPRPHK